MTHKYYLRTQAYRTENTYEMQNFQKLLKTNIPISEMGSSFNPFIIGSFLHVSVSEKNPTYICKCE